MSYATHCIPYDDSCSICNPPRAVTPDRPSIEAELQDVHRAAVLMDGREDTVGAFHDALAALRARFLEQQTELEEAKSRALSQSEALHLIYECDSGPECDLCPVIYDKLDAMINDKPVGFRAAIQPGGTPQK